MTAQTETRLSEAEVTALRDEYFARAANGDWAAITEFFLLRGIDFRGEWEEVTDDPAGGG